MARAKVRVGARKAKATQNKKARKVRTSNSSGSSSGTSTGNRPASRPTSGK